MDENERAATESIRSELAWMIERAGTNIPEIEQAAGIESGRFDRFMRSETHDITIWEVDRLAACVGWAIRIEPLGAALPEDAWLPENERHIVERPERDDEAAH